MKRLYIGFIFILSFSLLLPGMARVNAEEETQSHTVKIMSYNIAHGQGSDNGTVDLERIAKVIEDSGADIIGLQEVDRFYSDRSDYEDQLKVLAELLGFEYYVYGANLDLNPHEGYEARQYGTGILSKYPIKDSENVLLNSYGREQRGVLRATIDINGVDTNIYNTHLALPDEDRMGQVNEIIELMEDFPGPKMVMGDLNSESHFEDFKHLINAGNLTDTFVDVENSNTFRANDPIKRIDYILTSPLITFDNQEVIQTLASDHLPIVLDATIYEASNIELTVIDADDSDALLENAVFEVRDAHDNVVVSDVTTDKDGQAVIEQLSPGDYELIQIEAPVNFDLNTDPLAVTVGKGEIQKVVVTNGLTKGSVEIVVVDQDDNDIRLTDGIFELQDTDGQTLQSELSPNNDGKLIIKDLKPGNYQIVQLEAPTHYDLNESSIEFTIDKGQTDIPVITFTNEITSSSAELIMIDQKTSQPIMAGTFDLQDIEGNTLQTGLTVSASGKLNISDLKPGKYQLIATETPEGYEKITDPIEFTIEYDSKEDVVIVIGLKHISDEPEQNEDPEDPTVDASELENEVSEIINETLDEKSYTASSWDAFMSALEDAQALIDHLDITQADIDNTLSKLKSTRENLVLVDEENEKETDDNGDQQNDNEDGNGATGTNGGSNQSGDKESGVNDKGPGKELPKTATPMFNMLMIGFIVLLSAGALLIIVNRKNKIN